jgi:hypothetical protein
MFHDGRGGNAGRAGMRRNDDVESAAFGRRSRIAAWDIQGRSGAI